jgi:hypothetical protein
MGLFDEAKKMASGKGGAQDGQDDGQDGQDKDNPMVKNAMDKGEKFVNDKTDNKYESQVESGGNAVQDQVQKRMPNQ